MIHQFNPDMAADSDFTPGTLAYLVPGNRGRMLDPRRTPIQVLALRPEVGLFVCEVLDFEDRGAHWELPFEDVRWFQFEHASRCASPAELQELEAAVARFDRPLEIPRDPSARTLTLERLEKSLREAGRWLEAHSSFFRAGGRLGLSSRDGDPRLWADLESYLGTLGSWPIEETFARQFVSNPGAGECVKGHRIVLAELGLAEYRGKVMRDPELFAGSWSKRARADHILARLAFVHEVFTRAGVPEPVLYRGIATDNAPEQRRGTSFVSATFSREVAASMFEPAGGAPHGVLMRQRTPCSRLFMTYLETEPMNRQFREAEAVLLEQGEGAWF
jgi:hypothetical protein